MGCYLDELAKEKQRQQGSKGACTLFIYGKALRMVVATAKALSWERAWKT